jgi:DNA-binding response OmpR family regulator
LRRTLPESWTVVGAESLRAAREALAESEFDVVLLDLGLPDGAGDDLLGLVGRAKVIIFSATDPSTELSARVAAAMVKSSSNPVDVRDAILALLPKSRVRGGQP